MRDMTDPTYDLSVANVADLKEHCRVLYECLARCWMMRFERAPEFAGPDHYLKHAEDAVRLARIALAAAEEHLGIAKGRTEGN